VFDIGFSEFLVIGIVALLVIGPERLPKVARTAGHLFGRMQRYVADVKADLNREMDASELRDIKNTVTEAANSMQDAMQSHVGEINQEIRKAEDEFGKLTNPMLHFGVAGGVHAANSTSSPVESSDGASPQLDLGLGGDDLGAPAAGKDPESVRASS
jgi:sec-independent protein translocase protein TatB